MKVLALQPKDKYASQIVFATQSSFKMKEFVEFFNLIPENLRIKYTLARIDFSEINVAEPAETTGSVWGNALAKAEAYQRYFRMPVFTDDSGIFVDALGGQPGAETKYFGEGEDFPFFYQCNSNAKILHLLSDKKNLDERSANIKTTICFFDGKNPKFFTGTIPGHIGLTEEIAPDGWANYDLIFRPMLNQDLSANPAMCAYGGPEKVKVSARYSAINQFLNFLSK